MLRREAVGFGVLLLLCCSSVAVNAQTKKPEQPSETPTVFKNYTINNLRPDTTADRWLEAHIAISSRHYVGAEIGTTRSWMVGNRGFYFQHQTSGVDDNLPFGALGSGQGLQFGGVVDFSLSDFIGLQGKIRYFNTISSSSQVGSIVTTGTDAMAHGFETVTSYTNTHTFLGGDALVRYQLVPQQYYALGGAGISWPVSETFTASRTAVSNTTQTYVPAFATSTAPSDAYFNSFRADLKFGVGTFIPITEDVVATPELMFSFPVTSYFSRSYEAYYKSAGVKTPHQPYVSASISIKFPNGGFSLYALERDRHRQYEDQFRRASVLHPIPMLRNHFVAEIPKHVATATVKPDSMPDYEVDVSSRMIRWEDIGPNVPRKLRLTFFFEFGKADLAPYNFGDLDKLVVAMTKHPNLVTEIAAYTDSKGSMKLNMALSERRAQAVQNYLIAKGIDLARIPARGYGPNSPVATNDTPEGRASNRRVELVVVKDQATLTGQ